MSNYAWVCFDCRMAVRRSGLSKDVRCPSCARACESLGTKVPIPPKAKLKAWQEMRERFYRYQRAQWLTVHKKRVGQVQELEQQLSRLVTMPAKAGRTQRIAYLTRRLKTIRSSPL